jgi:dihydrolipoamide dehydrogenase
MRTLTTDVAILGAGTAGLNARREVERSGKRYLLIESGPYGTMCARTGCMPSKLLIAAAEAAHSARRASLFGVQISSEAVRVDRRAVLERVRRERDRFTESNVRATEAIPEESRLRGRARFVAPNALMVDDHTRVVANSVVIATGSTPVVPPELEPLGERILTTDTLFELDLLPESVAVFGTGAIGLELGQALHQLGVRVAFYNPFDVLGPFTDPVVDERLRALLSAELDLSLGVQVTGVRVDGGSAAIRHRDTRGQQHERRFTYALAAVGRKPALADLDLEKAGVELDDKGVPRFSRETTQCGSSSVFIAGDADGFRPLLHEASDEGRIAGANAAKYPNVEPHVRRVTLQIAFTSPQLAMVGKTYREAEGCEIAVGEVSYDDQGRARVMGQNRGHVRLYGDRATKTLIGAEMFGPAAEHTAHLLAWSIQQQLTVHQLLTMPVYHPTVEEGIRTALRDLAKNLDALVDCSPEERSESPAD